LFKHAYNSADIRFKIIVYGYGPLDWALFCVSLLVRFLFLFVFPAGVDQLNCLSWHTRVRYEAIEQVLGYESAAAPPLMAGSIVADLWHQTCLEMLAV